MGALRCICVVCAGLTWASPAAEAAWHEPDSAPLNQNAAHAVNNPSAVTAGGVPYVAWSEQDTAGQRQILVRRLNPAGTGWVPVGSGASPVNHDPARSAEAPSLAEIGGVPWVAWTEFDGTSTKVRVSRLNQAGTAWQEVVGGANPINHDPNRGAVDVSLAAIAGVPYVAWREDDGANREVRVSRLNPSGTAWQEVVGGASPINRDPTRTAFAPSLADVGGVPYVAWGERSATSDKDWVSRLNQAGTAWEGVGGPLNHDVTRDAFEPSLIAIGGVPYVAWYERDGVNSEVRVSRLSASGGAWQEIVGGASPVNHDATRDAFEPSLTAIGGAPYVAWEETDGTNFEIRVGRFDGTAGGWREVVGGASPVNHVDTAAADEPVLADVGGVPYVAWREFAGTSQTRAGRLEPEFSPPEAIASAHDAALLTRVRTYGVAYPVAFDYGTGGGLGARTGVTTTAADRDTDTVLQAARGLSSSTTYDFRALGFDGSNAIAPTAAVQFATTADNVPGPDGPAGTGGAAGLSGQGANRLLVFLLEAKLRARPGRRVGIEYLSTGGGAATLEVLKGRTRIARVSATARAGRNKVAWNGRRGRKKAGRGTYTLRLSVAGADGQSATASGKLTLKGA